MATVNELIDQTWEILGENSTLYPQDEVILNGINPAQRLLCLMRPDLLTQRVAVSVIQNQMFIDLRQEAPRAWQITRVVVGDVTGDAPVRSNGELYDLTPASLKQLMRRRNWWQHLGRMANYWRHGRYWLGIYRRPLTAYTLTLVSRAMPTAFRRDQFDGVPDVATAWHATIAKVAAPLLLIKEGSAEIQKAMQMLMEVFGEEPLRPMQRALERTRRQGAGVT